MRWNRRDSSDDPGEVNALLEMLRDENLRFPRRPRFPDDIEIFEMPDGLGFQFRAHEAPIILRGGDVSAVLAHLRPAFDGGADFDTILRDAPTGLSIQALLQTLALLHTKGLLVDAEATGDGQPAPVDGGPPLARQLLFWGRHIGQSRNAASSAEIQHRLSSARLVIVASGLFGAATYDILSRSGCRDIWVLAWDDDGIVADLADAPGPPARLEPVADLSLSAARSRLADWMPYADLTVTATRNAPHALDVAVNQIALDAGKPWLRGNINTTQVDIGPLVLPWESACIACLHRREASARDHAVEEQIYQEHLAQPRANETGPPIGEAFASSSAAAGLLALEAVRTITRLTPPALIDTVMTLLPISGGVETNRFMRDMSCPECGQEGR